MWTFQDIQPRPLWPRRRLSEDELADAWEQRAYAGQYLVDCCGRHLRVVFPGRRWGGPGPDFVGAVLAQRDGMLLRGDVEVHPRASSWAAHRHSQDPAYQRVVLHVVQLADALALDALGAHVPTVQLELEPGRGPPSAVALARVAGQPPARQRERGPCVREAPAVVQIVEAAGRQRFRARAARFEGDLASLGPDQVVWRGVCEALGFRRNTRSFGQLADAVPWSQAAAVVVERGPVGLAGLLLGAAGLLREATLPEAHAWRALQRSHGVRAALGAGSWDRRQVRAANAPAHRCRGLAELAARWAAPEAGRAGPAELVRAAVHAAAGVRRPRLWPLVSVSPWLGRGRAQVVAINVLLPFAAASGDQQAQALFERLPGEPTNRIVRYMADQLGAPSVRFRGACQQQGLLQLFKLTCAARACDGCPARNNHALPGVLRANLEDAPD